MNVSSVFSAKRIGSPTGSGSDDAEVGSGSTVGSGSGCGSGVSSGCSWSWGAAVTTASAGSGMAPTSGKDTGSGSGSGAGPGDGSRRDSSASSGSKMMGAATAEVEGASASVVGGDSTGSTVGGTTIAELSSARSSALVEVGTADEVAAGRASASAELGGRTTRSESGSELPQPAAASAAAVPAAARTHRRHRRRRSRRMHDNKSMVHLSGVAERCSSGIANRPSQRNEGGRSIRPFYRRGLRAPRNAADCGRGMKPIQDRASWLAQTLPGSNRQKQGLSRDFLWKPAKGLLRPPSAVGETKDQAGILPEEMWVERASGPDGDPGEPQAAEVVSPGFGGRWRSATRSRGSGPNGGQPGFWRERLWKLANRGRKPNWTRPVGPLRCLATEISARPAVSALEGL